MIGLIPLKEGGAFPIKTFIINVMGSFLIGVIVALVLKNQSLNFRVVLFLKVGICGGLTTFSSFALEISDLIKNENVTMALLYVVLSIVAGIVAVFAGQEIIK